MKQYDDVEPDHLARNAARSPDRDVDRTTQTALARREPGRLDSGRMAALQRAAGNSGVAELVEEGAGDRVRSVLSSSGRPLDAATRGEMESGMGADFSSVRVHTDGDASRSASAVAASAYTVGDDVVFGDGQYDPSSTSGKRTLAHELTHVVQQRSGAVEGTAADDGIKVSDPSDRFEREAEANADAFMSRSAVDAPTGVQRSPDGAGGPATQVQREGGVDEEEMQMQREGAEEEEELQMQREGMEEEEEEMQMQRSGAEEEEEEMQMQRSGAEEEEMPAG